MKKIKVTKKMFKNEKIVKLGYCELKNILSYFNPNYYTCGVYGWEADIYDFGNLYICTGYRPFGNVKEKKENYKILRKADKKAEKISKLIWEIEKNKKIYILFERKKQIIKKLLENTIKKAFYL